MKKLLLLPLLLVAMHSQSQTYVKVNAFTTLLTIPNVAVETKIGEKSTLNFDVLASLWKSVNGKPREFYTFTSEYRYHFKSTDNGFYVGGNIGLSAYNFQKWNYINTDYYERGKGYFIGSTIGYKAKINDKFYLDCFLGGGWHQGFYRGYRISDGTRYEHAQHYNKSGEWFPYRGGVMVSYKLN
ncbi:DUF3575 domain-containing protein [Flavobacterium muglaense]|uniref:DUF3575 domain-containing protein n=1 Tax=Flavobacterium muglaense TaxID=2764716 RepID=A0A923N0T2_9FLAO|nr:DUF3575 domain-containing protein [Flavobacterium muglaense]MBC5838015.1 DUF3575 domain-containing protein [Flavobacterium muglaense]MBC5844549.1 DUF3575 domain-containing protein [Flavobacterium muglaense]